VAASDVVPAIDGFRDAPCPLCGDERARLIVSARDRLAPRDPQTYSVVRCLGCGLGYLRPRPTPEAAGRYYPEGYGGPAPGGRLNALEAAYRRRQHREVAAWLASRRPRRGRVLDAGCGVGDLLVALRDDGWNARGVEPLPEAAAYAKEVHGLDVIATRFEDAGLTGERFDSIVFSGTLEHMDDPLAALRRARDLLASGGLVAVLFLPLLDSPEARLFGPRWMALDLPRHLIHFDDVTFPVMAARAGLEVVGREEYSRRHNAAQLVGSVCPGLQKHRFYASEATTARGSGVQSPRPAFRRAAFLAATTVARPITRLATAAGAPSMCSYFLEPADDVLAGP
jgi:SAM-dependent methyltransferase